MTAARPFQTISQIVAAAEATLDPRAWNYLAGGAGSEAGLHRNSAALENIVFRPRVLRDVSHVDASATLLGQRLRIPVFLSPIGSLGRFHAGGSRASATAAARFGTDLFYGLHDEIAMEELAHHSNRPLIFQLYVRGGIDWACRIGERARALGFRALCVTVDSAWQGRRERDLQGGFDPAEAYRRPNIEDPAIDASDNKLAALTWDDLRTLGRSVDLPLIVKGIQTGEDAALAVQAGAHAVYVSNHGGRQLDAARASIDSLPEVVAAVNGQAEVYIDSGFRSGSDVVKALALGATAVGIGKLHGFSLAADGEHGVHRALEILEAEILTTLGLIGARTPGELNPSFLQRSFTRNTP